MIEVETGVVPFPKDGAPAVLLQLPDGYVILRSVDARRVAEQLMAAALDADVRQN